MSQTNTLTHVKSLKTNSSSSLVQLSCNGIYLAAPVTKTTIGVWSLQSLDSKPLELLAHKRPASSVCFGKCHNPTSLCSAADDYVIVWNIEKARSQHENGQQIRGQIVGQRLGYIQYICFNFDDSLIALCIEREVHVYDVKSQELHTLLEGHAADVTCAEFCDHHGNTVVTASEDRTFKIWDLSSSTLIYQSSIISAHPFLSLSVDAFQDCIALGSADGQLRVYDIREGSGYKLLHQLEVEKMIQKQLEKKKQEPKAIGSSVISSKPSWQTPSQQTEEDPVDEVDTDSVPGGAVLSLWFHQGDAPKNRGTNNNASGLGGLLRPDEKHVEDLIEDSSYLFIGTAGFLLMMHTKSFEGEVVSFQDSVLSTSPDTQNKPIPIATSFAFGALPDSKKVWCVTLSAFQNCLEVMHISIPSTSGSETIEDKFSEQCSISDETADKAKISVIANVPLLESSILRSEMSLTPAGALPAKTKSKTKKSAQKGVQSQPLTFQRKIKSSGYSSAPRTKMFSPNTSQGKSSFSKSKKSQLASGTKNLYKEFPVKADPPNTLKYSLTVADQPVVISDLHFSDDGQYLGCALGDKSAQVMKMPLTKLGTCLTGHNGPLNSVSWSHDGAWLITSSDDKTAKVWARGEADSVLTFHHIKHNQQQEEPGPTSKGGTSKKENPCFSKEIKHAQFYYVDKFIILTSGNSFYLYKYNLDSSRDEIKRYETRSRYKLVKEFSMEEANQVTCLSAVNEFYSYVVICSGSDKSIELFDLNVGQRLTKIEAAHSRCVHSISQNKGSNFASISPSAYNMFATAAVTDGIKVWDVRTNRCIRKLEGHLNRAHACGATFSPCGQYLVTGSEDKAAYVFDLREGAVIEKLMGHTDVVSCVAYHPLYAEILTGTLDGKLRLFSDR